ncbi:MAG: DUF3060 domain-containing protein [Vicinamibacteria bacterium]
MRAAALVALLLPLAAAAGGQQREVVDAGTSPVIAGTGERRSVTCNRGRVTVEGRDNQVVMRGPCERVAIKGSGHKVVMEEVGSLSIQGSGQDVQWVRGLDGRDPKVTQSGSGHTVRKITAEEYAKVPAIP